MAVREGNFNEVGGVTLEKLKDPGIEFLAALRICEFAESPDVAEEVLTMLAIDRDTVGTMLAARRAGDPCAPPRGTYGVPTRVVGVVPTPGSQDGATDVRRAQPKRGRARALGD